MYVQVLIAIMMLSYFGILTAGAFSQMSGSVRTEQVSTEIRGELEKHLADVSGEIYGAGGLREYLSKYCRVSGHLNPVISCNYINLFGPLEFNVDPDSNIAQLHRGKIEKIIELHDYRSTFDNPQIVQSIPLHEVGFLEVSVVFTPDEDAKKLLGNKDFRVRKLIPL